MSAQQKVSFEGTPGPTELTLDAALELAKVKNGKLASSPALDALIAALTIESSGSFGSPVSMLSDIRNYSILKTASGINEKNFDFNQFRQKIRDHLNFFKERVESKDSEAIDEARKFCLALNRLLVAQGYQDTVKRRGSFNSLVAYAD